MGQTTDAAKELLGGVIEDLFLLGEGERRVRIAIAMEAYKMYAGVFFRHPAYARELEGQALARTYAIKAIGDFVMKSLGSMPWSHDKIAKVAATSAEHWTIEPRGKS